MVSASRARIERFFIVLWLWRVKSAIRQSRVLPLIEYERQCLSAARSDNSVNLLAALSIAVLGR
jgi:hypothetical protein